MDIKNSRKIIDRTLFQNKLNGYIKIISDKYHCILPAPITITLGDEWQLITDQPWKCYDLIHEFQQLLWKEDINLYAGIGIGTIDTELDQDIRRIDGPCFHKAREALNTVKQYYRLKDDSIHSSKNRVYLKVGNLSFNKCKTVPFVNKNIYNDADMLEEAALDIDDRDMNAFGSIIKEQSRKVESLSIIEKVINTLIENNEILKQKMTKNQKALYVDYIKVKSYRKLVEKNASGNESISGISQKLNSAEFFTIQHNQRLIGDLIYDYCVSIIHHCQDEIGKDNLKVL